jgi:hypothetical protein
MADKIRRLRDAKAKPHLEQYAPVWLESEQVIADKDVVVFNVVFRHPIYGWVSRRYRYDSFNDVLYHQGQRALNEADTLAMQATEPYIDTVQSDVPNSYGG